MSFTLIVIRHAVVALPAEQRAAGVATTSSISGGVQGSIQQYTQHSNLECIVGEQTREPQVMWRNYQESNSYDDSVWVNLHTRIWGFPLPCDLWLLMKTVNV